MKPSPRSCIAIERLLVLAERLLTSIEHTSGWTKEKRIELASLVRRYHDLVARGLTEADAVTALRGANLLSTVNKGIGDIREGDDDEVGDAARAVTNAAFDTAELLHTDIGDPPRPLL